MYGERERERSTTIPKLLPLSRSPETDRGSDRQPKKPDLRRRQRWQKGRSKGGAENYGNSGTGIALSLSHLSSSLARVLSLCWLRSAKYRTKFPVPAGTERYLHLWITLPNSTLDLQPSICCNSILPDQSAAREMGDTAVDIFLESLKQLITNSKLLLIKGEKHQLQSLEMEIKYLREFLKATEKIRNEHTEVMNLVMQIRDVVFESENTVELFVGYAYNQDHLSRWDKFFEWLSLRKLFHWDRLCELFLCRLPCNDQNHLSLDLECVKKEIKTLMDKVKQIYDKNVYDINRIAVKKLEHSFTGSSGGSLRGSSTSKVGEEKVVVGFEKEMHKLMGQLHNSRKGGRLEIISIIGAPGGGKTTLATEVYQYPFTSHAFDILAWVVVSQDYDKTKKRDMLISILQSASQEKYKDYVKISNENILGEKVHKCLKGRKYLIVMDDIWSIEAWNDIQRSFPRECKGSKVLFTSRQLVVQLDSDDYVHHLAPLQESHSWELLQKKIRCICLEVWNRMESKLVPFSRWVQSSFNGRH